MLRKSSHSQEIRKMYVLHFLGSLSFSTVIWVLYLQKGGLTLFEITILQSLINFGMLILEIPTGIIADVIGGKKSLLMAKILLALQAIFLILWPGVFSLQVIGFLGAGFGYALLSGTEEAILYRNIVKEGKEQETSKIFGTFASLANWGAVAGMVAGGMIGEISGQYVYVAVLIAETMALLVVFALRNDRVISHHESENHFKDYISSLKRQKGNYALLIGLSLIVAVVSLYYLYGQRVLADVAFSVSQIGIIFALSHVAEGFANTLSHKLEKKFETRPASFFTAALVGMLLLFSLLFIPSKIIYVASFLLINILFALVDPIMMRIVNEKIDERFRTAMISTFNFLSSVAMFMTGPLLGYATANSQFSFTVLIAIFSIALLLLTLAVVLKKGGRLEKAVQPSE